MVLRQEINCALKSIQGFFFIFLDFEYFAINGTVLIECCVGDPSIFLPLTKYVYLFKTFCNLTYQCVLLHSLEY